MGEYSRKATDSRNTQNRGNNPNKNVSIVVEKCNQSDTICPNKDRMKDHNVTKHAKNLKCQSCDNRFTDEDNLRKIL